MKYFCIAALLFLPFLPALQAQASESIDWDYEIDLLARELAEVHPDLFFKTDSASYYHSMKAVASRAPGHSVFQVAVQLQQVLACMGDAQTMVNYHFLIEKSGILPLELYWFEEGIYVLQCDRLYEPLLGNRLTAINGYPVETVIDSMSTLLVVDNYSVLKNSIPRMLTWFQLLEYFGFASGNSVSIRVAGSSGTEEVVIGLPVELGEMLYVEPQAMPLGWEDQKAYFRDLYFEGESLYYIQYNRCWSREAEEDYGTGASALFMPSFREFEKQVYPVIKRKKIDKLVFDLRFNKGGYAPQGTELIRNICRYLPKDHGDIFVLVGRMTCAEAIINAVDFMNCAKVVLVGEPTCGTPNYFGEVHRFVLPESHLIVSHPTVHISLLEDNPPALIPRYPAAIGFVQYMKGIDPAMEMVRKLNAP